MIYSDVTTYFLGFILIPKQNIQNLWWSLIVCRAKKELKLSMVGPILYGFVCINVENGSNIFLNCPLLCWTAFNLNCYSCNEFIMQANLTIKSTVTHKNQSQNTTWIPQERSEKSVEENMTKKKTNVFMAGHDQVKKKTKPLTLVTINGWAHEILNSRNKTKQTIGIAVNGNPLS